MRNVDSDTLFKQARLEMKAAAAYYEEVQSAQRYIVELRAKRDDAYLEALALGVPAFIAANVAKQVTKEMERIESEGLFAMEMSNYHRECGEALLTKYHKTSVKEFRRFTRRK